MRRISPKMAAQIANERELKKQLIEQTGGLCQRCHTTGDWRGLSLSHNRNKGMGGTTHVYTIDEVELLCYPCHNREKHGIHEV